MKLAPINSLSFLDTDRTPFIMKCQCQVKGKIPNAKIESLNCIYNLKIKLFAHLYINLSTKPCKKHFTDSAGQFS